MGRRGRQGGWNGWMREYRSFNAQADKKEEWEERSPLFHPPSHSLFHSHVPVYGAAFPISKTPHVEKRERERAEEIKFFEDDLKGFLR